MPGNRLFPGGGTSLLPVAHLTCVGHTRSELESILDEYEAAGVHHVLALRGDPADGPRADWVPVEGGLTYASELVELAAARPAMRVGVAAFPEKHPASPSLDHDADVLVAKARAGAELAVTQMPFDSGDRDHDVDQGMMRADGLAHGKLHS